MSTKRVLTVDYEANRELVLSGTKAVKHHFLESELVRADNLIQDYGEYVDDQFDEEAPYGAAARVNAARQKLIWLLERLQEEVL